MKSAPIYFTKSISNNVHPPLTMQCMNTHINRKLPPHPHKLRRVRLDLSHATTMGLSRGDGIFAQVVDDLEVAREGVRVLVVLCGDVGFDGRGKLELVCPAEGDLEDVAGLHGASRSSVRAGGHTYKTKGGKSFDVHERLHHCLHAVCKWGKSQVGCPDAWLFHSRRRNASPASTNRLNIQNMLTMPYRPRPWLLQIHKSRHSRASRAIGRSRHHLPLSSLFTAIRSRLPSPPHL